MKKKYNPWKKHLSRKLVEQIEKLKPDEVVFRNFNNIYMECEIKRDKEYAYGYAICSVIDKFDEKRGKNLSAGRAVKAMKRKISDERKREALDRFPQSWTLRQVFRIINVPIYFKSHYETLQ